jgi:hypothetical protein
MPTVLTAKSQSLRPTKNSNKITTSYSILKITSKGKPKKRNLSWRGKGQNSQAPTTRMMTRVTPSLKMNSQVLLITFNKTTSKKIMAQRNQKR